MNTTEPSGNTPMALSPPGVPEATSQVTGADYGVPKHVYDLKPMGLKVVIDPPLDGTLRPNDTFTIELNGQSVASKSINPGEENLRHILYVPKNLLLVERVNHLLYTITRDSLNRGTSTPVLTLLYNAIRPGMEDRTPGDGAHSELELILPLDVIEDGIDADRAKQGVLVCFTYPFCRAHDDIRLNCNGKDVHHKVTIAEAPAIPSSEPTTICHMVEEADFLGAGDHPAFAFSYTVTDQLGNGPDTDSPWSGAIRVDVHLKEQRLVAPDMAEDPDDPNDDPSTIDLAKLGSKDLTVLVHVFAPLWQPNDKVRVSYTATPPSGPVVQHSVEADIVRIPFTYKLMIPNAKVIAGSVVRAKYELVRGGIVIATSRTATADVSGGSSVELLPAFLVSPATDPIDSLNYPNVTIRIQNLSALDGDRARLVEVDAPVGAPQFPLVAFNSNKRVNTVLSAAFWAARHGKVVRFLWNLNRGGGQVGKSPVLNVNVLKIEDGDPRLPTPVITQATGSDGAKVLDLKSFDGDATVTIKAWPGIAQNQRFWLSAHGKKTDGADHLITLAAGTQIIDAEVSTGLIKTLLRTELNGLADGPLRIEMKVTLDGNTDVNIAVEFATLNVTFKGFHPLTLDTTPLHLSGRTVSIALPNPGFLLTGNHPVGAFANRPASGGVGSITYTSNNPLIAGVTSTGMVWSEGNGTTTINVSDETDQKASYDVTVSNVEQCLTSTYMSDEEGLKWIAANGHAIAKNDVSIFNTKFTFITETGYLAGRSLDPVRPYWAIGYRPTLDQLEWVAYNYSNGHPRSICYTR